MRQELSHPARKMCRQPLLHLLQIHIRVQPVQPGRLQGTHHGGCTLAARREPVNNQLAPSGARVSVLPLI